MSDRVPKSLLAKLKKQLKSNESRYYFTSIHFWAPLGGWFIPFSTVVDFTKEPKFISGQMTFALALYSIAFIRFAWKVKPRNLMIVACHSTNLFAQTVQGYHFLQYVYFVRNKQTEIT